MSFKPGVFKLRKPNGTRPLITCKLPAKPLNAGCPIPIDQSDQNFVMNQKLDQSLNSFVKRFSMRPAVKTSDITEPKRRMSMLSNWRRRRSSIIVGRERSPLKPSNESLQIDEVPPATDTHRIRTIFRDFRRKTSLFGQTSRMSALVPCDKKPDEVGEPVHEGLMNSVTVAALSDKDEFLVEKTHTIYTEGAASVNRKIDKTETCEASDVPTDQPNTAVQKTFNHGPKHLSSPSIYFVDRMRYSSSNSSAIELVSFSPTLPRTENKITQWCRPLSLHSIGSEANLPRPTSGSDWSSEISSLDQRNELCESTGLSADMGGLNSTSSSSSLQPTTGTSEWTHRLRKSLNRAERICHLCVGRTLFNKDPCEGIQYLINNRIVGSHPSALARFLFNEKGLSRQAIGDYFGSLQDDTSNHVLKEYLSLIDMLDLQVDEAVRVVLSHLHPPGESQKISHLMHLFQEAYVAQNSQLVGSTFRSNETVEVLAYSILMLHTDLHNPNVRRFGHRMSEAEFVTNNRGIDAGFDLPASMLRGIYRRIGNNEFKTLPDPVDRLRRLDSILIGSLKTDNFIQRHRRFLGWVAGYQLDRIPTRQSHNRKRGRHILVFNDILIVCKPVMGSLLNSSVWNLAANAATNTDRPASPSPKAVNQYCSEEPMTNGQYYIRMVLLIKDISVLVFETQHTRYGVRLCNLAGPVYNFALSSSHARQQFVEWIHMSMAEISELQAYYKRCAAAPENEEEVATQL